MWFPSSQIESDQCRAPIRPFLYGAEYPAIWVWGNVGILLMPIAFRSGSVWTAPRKAIATDFLPDSPC
jgi:hypothetical protein